MAGTSDGRSRNRLAFEKSPYLLQHAENPVDWYPWGEEAFKRAAKENKLIFLSVGYSTCHWCHVMERESFENEEIAKIMNENFVCIKVDREERPDVDKLYMTYVQVNTGGGGWPMSVWLTPGLEPVFGGTYFPPDDQYGRPGFKSVLNHIAKQWKEGSQKFSEAGKRIISVLEQISSLGESSSDLSTRLPKFGSWDRCLQQLSSSFEKKYGGFSEAPKFPQPVNLNFLFSLYAKEPKSESGKEALEMATFTLKMMAKGGIHDHIGQGFARYSVDGKWHVPHFEKMLYDQGQLVVAYTSAYLATKDQIYADVIEDILNYVNRDLSHPSGGFYSAEDADSLPSIKSKEKKEGAFYVWTHEEIKTLLNETIPENPEVTHADIFSFHYTVKPEGNVSPTKDPHGELKNKNVLIVFGSEEETAQKFELSVDKVKEILEKSRKILYETRSKRPRPHLDDKMLTGWNGLMISGFAKAGQALENQNHIQRAVGAAKFVRRYLYDDSEKTLLRSCYKGEKDEIAQPAKPINGFLDDYAFLIRGLLDLYEASFDPTWIEWAENLQETQDRLFWDEGSAGYFTSPAGDSSILIRMKEDQDGAEPSGNSVSVLNLLRLSSFLDNPNYKEKAGKILGVFSPRLNKMPIVLPEMVCGLIFYNDGPVQIFITGKKEEPETASLLNVVNKKLIPNKILALADGNEDSILYKKCDVIRSIKAVNGVASAYVCRNRTCSLPVSSREELAELLDQQK